LLAVLTIGPVLTLLALVGTDEIRYGMFLKKNAAVRVPGVEGRTEVELLQEFLARHPASSRAAQVRARLAMNLEKAETAMGTSAESPPRPAGPPAKTARDVWQELAKANPESPWAADAYLRLGDAYARQGLFDPAKGNYQDALARASWTGPIPEDPLAKSNVAWSLLTIGADMRAHDDAAHLEKVRQEVLTRLAILADNRRDSDNNSAALGRYFTALTLKGTPAYGEKLLEVRVVDPMGKLADNVAFDLAMLEPDGGERIEALKRVAAAWPDTDGAMLARLKVAESLVTKAASDPTAMGEAKKYLKLVKEELDERRKKQPDDPYVAEFADPVEKKLIYVESEIQPAKAKADRTSR
jgi:hypothetical protein